jgi:hypothetical protein
LGEGIRALKDGMKDGIKENPQTEASTDPTKKTETKS